MDPGPWHNNRLLWEELAYDRAALGEESDRLKGQRGFVFCLWLWRDRKNIFLEDTISFY